MTSLVLSSDRLNSGPLFEVWDAIDLPSLTSLQLECLKFNDRVAFGKVNTGLQAFLQQHLQQGSRLSEVVLQRCSLTYGSYLVWAMVYNKIADLVSLSSHSALKSFKHTPTSWILQGENYLRAEHLGNNFSYYVGGQNPQTLLDFEAYDRLQAVLVAANNV